MTFVFQDVQILNKCIIADGWVDFHAKTGENYCQSNGGHVALTFGCHIGYYQPISDPEN
jgi:hypothetical protein